MPRNLHNLDFEPREGYLFARASGIRTRHSVATATKLIFEKAIELGISRVLVEVSDLEGTLSVLDSYSLVTDVFKPIRWGGINKAAVVDTDGSRIQMAFSEIVARNRGYNYRIFNEEGKAIKWLLAE